MDSWLLQLKGACEALIFPWSCTLCGTETSDRPFCPCCWHELLAQSSSLLACPRCALPAGPFTDAIGECAGCRKRSLGFDAALALGTYEGAIRTLCLQLKHESNAWLAPWLIDLLIRARGDALDRLSRDSWVVPVPLHWSRLWQRGYNQADALACGLAQQLRLPVRRLLRRVKATRRLASMGLTERHEVIRRAFRARAEVQLAGRTVVLVDDILTSGATCGAAARALRNVGAGQIVAIVIARATCGTT